MSRRSSIPLYSLDSNAKQGLYVRKFSGINAEMPRVREAHRDDHHIFILQEKGDSRMMVDFREVKVKGRQVFCILPGQVHHVISVKDTDAWFVAMEAALVHEGCRQVFGQRLEPLPPMPVKRADAERIGSCIGLLESLYRQVNDSVLHQQVIRSLTDAVTGMFAATYMSLMPEGNPGGRRPTIITRQFKALLQHSYKNMKTPSAYAAALNISPSYLNEAVKQTTGLPVSYWIQQEIMTEAKRMLYYTDLTVKEIAYALAYEDHTYFSRLFHKTAGMPPLSFRKKYRE